MYLLAAFILQNFKKILRADLMRMCHFRVQNDPFVLNEIFLVQTIIITFIYLLALFIAQNLKKKIIADPELWGCAIFGPKMVHLHAPPSIYFLENYITLIYLLAAFTVQNFKKFFLCIQSYEDAQCGPKITHFPKWEFFLKTC